MRINFKRFFKAPGYLYRRFNSENAEYRKHAEIVSVNYAVIICRKLILESVGINLNIKLFAKSVKRKVIPLLGNLSGGIEHCHADKTVHFHNKPVSVHTEVAQGLQPCS